MGTQSAEPDRQELQGKTAVVTGSTRGIGLAIATELAKAGAHVVLHGRTEPNLGSDDLRDAARSIFLRADLSSAKGRDELLDRAWNWRRGVDIWINNAGTDVLTGEAAEWPFEKKLQTLWDVDVLATILLSRAVGERMKLASRESGDRVILNIGWDQAEHGMAGESGEMFAAVKGAIMSFTRSLAKSLAPQVRVNCLAPGWIRTAWGEQASEYWQQRAVGESLLERWGTPQDVANVARFLASPAANFVTGQIVPINGGLK